MNNSTAHVATVQECHSQGRHTPRCTCGWWGSPDRTVPAARKTAAWHMSKHSA